jgi:NADH-quinone oxidoreductase subunit F
MLADKDRIFTNLYGLHDAGLKGAMARGAWDGTKAMLQLGRDGIIDVIKASGLRGRGGAGFPTGSNGRSCQRSRTSVRTIWSSMPTSLSPAPARTAKSCATTPFADRRVRWWQVSPWARTPPTSMSAASSSAKREALQRAVDEAYEAGLIGKNACGSGWDFDLYVHHGAGAYICGEETALLESLEGKKGQPRLKPPFPANVGLYGCPTTVNNVESIAVVPDHPAPWRLNGSPASAAKQHRHQAVLHLRSRQQAVHRRRGDGHPAPRADRQALRRRARRLGQPLAVIPGGSSVPACRPTRSCDTLMDFDNLSALKSGLGTAAVIVMDQSTDMIKAIARLAYFYKHEAAASVRHAARVRAGCGAC